MTTLTTPKNEDGVKWKTIAGIVCAAVLIFTAGYFFRGHIDSKRDSKIVITPPTAAVSADKAAEQISKIAEEIAEAQKDRQEVINNAKNNAVTGVSGLDAGAIIELWNSRLREYRMDAGGNGSE